MPPASARSLLTDSFLRPVLLSFPHFSPDRCDEPVFDYFLNLLLSEGDITSESHLIHLLKDLLVDYELAAKESEAVELCRKMYKTVFPNRNQQNDQTAPVNAPAAAATNKKGKSNQSLPAVSESLSASVSSSDSSEWLEIPSQISEIWLNCTEKNRGRLIPGVAVKAKNPEDARYYNAKIESLVEDEFAVKFTETPAQDSAAYATFKPRIQVGIGSIKILEKVPYQVAQSFLKAENGSAEERKKGFEEGDFKFEDLLDFASSGGGIKKLNQVIRIGDFGENKQQIQSNFGLSKEGAGGLMGSSKAGASSAALRAENRKALKQEAADRKLAQMQAAKEAARLERSNRLKFEALKRYLQSDRAGVCSFEEDNFSLSADGEGEELLSTTKLKIAPGKKYGLVGRNGTGKSTLLRAIATYSIGCIPANIRIVHVESEAIGDETPVIDYVLRSDVERELLLKEERALLAKMNASDVSKVKAKDRKANENRVRAGRKKLQREDLSALDEGKLEQEAELEAKKFMAELKELEDQTVAPSGNDDNDAEMENENEDAKKAAESESDGETEENEKKSASSNAGAGGPKGKKNAKKGNSKSAAIKLKTKKGKGGAADEPANEEEIFSLSSALSKSSLDDFSLSLDGGDDDYDDEDGPKRSAASLSPETRLELIYQRLKEIDSDTAEARAREILAGLQFTNEKMSAMTKELSGGWRMRVALAAALFQSPDLLLLDEPTNHLDFPSVLWLTDYLSTYGGTLILVSHDRAFVNSVATDIIHLHQRQLTYYRGDFKTFERVRNEKLRMLKREFEANKLRRAHIQEFIDRFRYNAKRAALVQSRIKTLQKMDELIEVVEDSKFKFSFPQPERMDGVLLGAVGITFGYDPKRTLFRDASIAVDMNSRIALLGANGVGKSSFLNVLLGKLTPSTGQITRNSAARVAFFSQHHVDQLNMSLTPLQLMEACFPGQPAEMYRRHLGRYGVTGDIATRLIASLSGGQKSRVAFALLSWRGFHLLVMDEPTNFLDLESIDALIVALEQFNGGVLVVSHDQHFLSSVCNEFYGFSAGKVQRFTSFKAAKQFSYEAAK